MTFPSDSPYAIQPVGDTGPAASSAFHEQVYSRPPSGGENNDVYGSGNSTFAPPMATSDSLPPLTVGPAADAAVGQPGALPPDASGAQTGANPWDTYVMNPVAESRNVNAQPEAFAPPEGAAKPEAAAPPEAVAQLEQQLQTTFDEVVKLGTGDLSQPENQQKFQEALTTLVKTAEMLGGADAMQGGAPMQPGTMAAGAQPAEAPSAGPGTQPAEAPAAAEATPQSEMPPADMTGQQSESAAGQPGAKPLEVNPYEPQVAPVTAEATAPQTAGSDSAVLQDQLSSQLTQLISIAKQAQPTSGAPVDLANSGVVDNFKTALLNVVKTARQLGAQEQINPGLQPNPSAAPLQGAQPSVG